MAATPDTVYQWGSVAKIATATAIMQLYEQGLIDLDAPVSDYLDYFPTEYPITVRHLLNHSAGIPESFGFTATNLRLDGQPLPDPDQVDRTYYEGFSGPIFEPGSSSAYSNLNYVTLGQIVADVSGQPFIEYVQQHILAPLVMENTDFSYSNEIMIARAAAGAIPAAEVEGLIAALDEIRGDGADFIRETDDRHAWLNRFNVMAAHGGLSGPVTELIRFLQMHLNGGELDGVRVLSPESVALMQEMQLSPAGASLGYGLGWEIFENGDHPYVEHAGSGEGIQALTRVYPNEGFALVLMSNAAGYDHVGVLDAAANVIFSMLAPPEPERAFTPPITDTDGNEIPGSITAIETVNLGGFEQTILIRGADVTKPVLLWLHGGPGLPHSPFVGMFQPPELEENFVVVHWDQRGAGKSYFEGLIAEDMRPERFVSDTLELTHLLREFFDQDKISLFGISWGSALGFSTIMKNSDPYHAFIAASEAADWDRRWMMSYEWALEQATEAKNVEVIQGLESLQPFDPTDREHTGLVGQVLDLFRGGNLYTEGLWDEAVNYLTSGESPEYTSADVDKLFAGVGLSGQTTSLDVSKSDYNLFRDFPVSPIPVHFFAGRHDYVTPGKLAEEYYNFLEAPAKSFTWFENSAHLMTWDEPDKAAQELIRIANETLGTVVSHGGPVTEYVSLVDSLRAASATVEPAGTISQPFFEPEGQFLTVNGEDVQAFEFASEVEADAIAETVSVDGSSVGTSMISWVAPPHFYKAGRLIVVYVGSNSGVIDLIQEILGPQFAGR